MTKLKLSVYCSTAVTYRTRSGPKKAKKKKWRNDYDLKKDPMIQEKKEWKIKKNSNFKKPERRRKRKKIIISNPVLRKP